MQDLRAHLQGGATTVCRCWLLVRGDGVHFGFTDHDRDLGFDGEIFKAGSGVGASALQQSTGLSVDNSQAAGALSDLGLTEADILAGVFDGAVITVWLVNWRDVTQRQQLFLGTLGEIQRGGLGFEAELRGLSEALNQPQGRAYHKKCAAVLGDVACGFDLNTIGYFAELAAEDINERRVFSFAGLTGYAERWFEKGRLTLLSGAAKGAVGVIKADRFVGQARQISLWQALPKQPAPGDLLRLEAGCDKALGSCALKFQNLANFRGFPHIPGEDWAMSYPVQSGLNDGESRY